MTALSFGFSQVAIVLLGLPAAFHPVVRHSTIFARVGASFLLGAVLLTLEGIVWSLLGIPWTIWTLGLPLGIASFAASILLARRPRRVPTEVRVEPEYAPIKVVANALTLCALAYLAWMLSGTRATSYDLLFFWGVKGVRFAAAGGLDAALLGWPYFIHAHVNYPPLLPTVLAWGHLGAGSMPWLWVPTASWFWVAATSAVLGPILRPRLGSAGAAVVTAVWTAVLSASMVASISGGNAEPPLVAYLTVACAALLAGSSVGRPLPWAVVALGFAGAALSKNEGMVSVLLLSSGALARAWPEHDWTAGIRTVGAAFAAAGAIGLWALFLAVNGLPLTDPARERAFGITFEYTGQILSAMPSALLVGTSVLSWWVLFIALVASTRRIVPYLPAVVLCCGLFLFVFVYYLHSSTDPTLLIGRTLPRLCQPALSALVLWAGLAWLGDDGERRPVIS